jgi:hypothetical protein
MIDGVIDGDAMLPGHSEGKRLRKSRRSLLLHWPAVRASVREILAEGPLEFIRGARISLDLNTRNRRPATSHNNHENRDVLLLFVACVPFQGYHFRYASTLSVV